MKKLFRKIDLPYEKSFRRDGSIRASVSRSSKKSFIDIVAPIALLMLRGPDALPPIVTPLIDDGLWDKISEHVDATFVDTNGALFQPAPKATRKSQEAKTAFPPATETSWEQRICIAIESLSAIDIDSLSSESRIRVLAACAKKLGERQSMTRTQKNQAQLVLLRATVETLSKRN